MAFTFDPTTDRGKVRLLISDTDTADATKQIFTDAEIDAFLSLGDNLVYAGAGAAARSMAVSATRSAFRMKVEKILEIDRKDQPKYFIAMAENFEAKANDAPFEEIDSMAYEVGHFGIDSSEYVGDTFN